ncbi:MAG: MBL fold metallo-hydrolase [Actinomycetota bacterium]|nr:MBL fold metallo-hydrolase [Actinomycetota bacterium]
MTHVARFHIGRIEISTVCQGWAPLPLADECPGREVDWAEERRAFPWAFDGTNHWRWHVHAFAVRTPAGLTMVDAGLGGFPPWGPWAPGEGIDTPEALARAEVDPNDVSTVVLTHLHPDHMGGSVSGGKPRFANARYVLHDADRRFSQSDGLDEYTALARDDLARLDELGVLDVGTEDREVAPGIEVLHTPGHTPGHRSVVVQDGEEAILLTGDLLHLPVQVAHPGWDSEHDEDPSAGARSRIAMLDRARHEGWTVGVPHFAHPFGQVEGTGWEEAPLRT